MRKSTLLAGACALGIAIATPAAAWRIVFDPTNYSQNLLSAARALEQINNQITSLQNESAMLQNMAKQLQRLDFSSLGQITGSLQRIDGLMEQAEGISFDISEMDAAWKEQFPEGYDAATTVTDMVGEAQKRWQSAMQAFRQTMRVQSQVVENVQADRGLLAELVNQSQGAVGSLQAQQATNQLLALSTKQQLQIQDMMAAQYRAEALGQARDAQSEEAARESTSRFLGSGKAYTPR
jgi:P-type conjugative transfer protein TrbJ